MIQVTPQMRILVAVDPVDFRKGIDGLAGIVKALHLDPFSGYLFVFRSRSGTSLQVLAYDSQGYLALPEEAVEGKVPLLAEGGETLHPLAAHELQALLWNKDPGKAAVVETFEIVLDTEALFSVYSHPWSTADANSPHAEIDFIGRLIATGANRPKLSRMFCEEDRLEKTRRGPEGDELPGGPSQDAPGRPYRPASSSEGRPTTT